MNIETLKNILVGGNYLSKENFEIALSKTNKHVDSIIAFLVEEGLLNEQLFAQAAAEYYKLSYYDLSTHKPLPDVVLRLSESIARNFHTVLASYDDKKVIVATDDLTKKDELIKVLQKTFPGVEIVVVFALKHQIDELLINYKNTLQTRFSEIIKENKRIAPEIINQIIEDALLLKASDIHFEPQNDDVLIRFRIDGLLSEAGRIEKKYYDNILNKIKVESSLRIDEHTSSQDGSMRFSKDGNVADIRISILPTIFGEKIVLRVLSYYVGGFALSELGFSEDNEALLKRVAKKPFGMILVTGPTGSGKTTTLYALIKHINNPSINITTIEDPVEYRIEGVNQIQVNEMTNLTFADGLRAIVRQDPDVILVGEIRDKETAEISVNAALTGHLLFSTFHANNAVSTIPRLLDMGIEPFLLASTLEAVIAQRLVRKICSSCRFSEELTTPMFGVSTVYKGRGCNVCNYTGYNGQVGVFECVEVTDEIEEAIVRNPDKKALEEIIRKEGVRSMFEDGTDKVRQGLTTLEEITRVIGNAKS